MTPHTAIGPGPGPGPAPEPGAGAGAGSRRLWLWPSAAAVLVLVVVAVVMLFNTEDTKGSSDQFEQAAAAFHDVYTPTAKDLTKQLALSGDSGGSGDKPNADATKDAGKLADAFAAYGKALSAIEFPADSKEAADELIRETTAGRLLMVNAAAFISIGEMQAALDQYRPQIETGVANAESSLRATLSA